MESIPVLSEFVQAGVTGLCLALIVTLVYVIRLYNSSLMTFSEVVRDFTVSLEKNNERLDRLGRLEDRLESRRNGNKTT
jgi:hypothetical protein